MSDKDTTLRIPLNHLARFRREIRGVQCGGEEDPALCVTRVDVRHREPLFATQRIARVEPCAPAGGESVAIGRSGPALGDALGIGESDEATKVVGAGLGLVCFEAEPFPMFARQRFNARDGS